MLRLPLRERDLDRETERETEREPDREPERERGRDREPELKFVIIKSFIECELETKTTNVISI